MNVRKTEDGQSAPITRKLLIVNDGKEFDALFRLISTDTLKEGIKFIENSIGMVEENKSADKVIKFLYAILDIKRSKES
jgi:hypothetical protein